MKFKVEITYELVVDCDEENQALVTADREVRGYLWNIISKKPTTKSSITETKCYPFTERPISPKNNYTRANDELI